MRRSPQEPVRSARSRPGIGLAATTLLALALVGCAGVGDDTGAEAPADEPIVEAPAAPDAPDATSTVEATGIVLAGGALEVELTDSSSVPLVVGTAAFDDAVAQVGAVAGTPDESGANADCGVDFATWGGLTLHGDPTSGTLVGWALRSPVPTGVSVRDAEAALGATRADVLARFSDAADFSDGDTTIGREWTGEGYAGLFSGASDADTITNLWSGNACIFR